MEAAAAALAALTALLKRFGGAYDTMIKQGRGARQLNPEQRFEGNLVDGVPHGHGAMTYPDGAVYMYVSFPQARDGRYSRQGMGRDVSRDVWQPTPGLLNSSPTCAPTRVQ